MLSGSASIKAALRMLMKLTPSFVAVKPGKTEIVITEFVLTEFKCLNHVSQGMQT